MFLTAYGFFKLIYDRDNMFSWISGGLSIYLGP